MQTSNVTVPGKQEKKLGLLPARIGFTLEHTLSVALPLDEPAHGTLGRQLGGKARVRLQRKDPTVELGINGIDGGPMVTKALPGHVVQCEVQDLTRLDPEDLQHLRWVCSHPDCKGKSYATKDELFRAHPKKDAMDKAERQRLDGGRAHVYFGVIETPGVDAKAEVRNDKGHVTQQAVAARTASVVLVSESE